MDNETPPPKPVPQELTPLQLITQSIHLLKAAEIKLQPKPTPTAIQQFKNFIRNFGDNPVKNTIKLFAIMTAIALLIFLLVLLVATFRQAKANEKMRRENQSYVAQSQALDQVKDNLNSLLDFVQSQKNKLQESEDIVNKLKGEQEKLAPVVATDRQIISAILDFQSQKAQGDIWKERFIGFAIGIVASIIASFIYAFSRRLLARRVTPSATPGE